MKDTAKKTHSPTSNDIEQALIEGASRYFNECRQRVPAFTRAHFAYPGCWHTNRVGLGWDMVRAPLNLLWAPVYALSALLAFACRYFAWPKFSALLLRTPSGLTTQVQKHLADLIYTDLLQRAKNNERPDRFQESILAALEEKLEVTTQEPLDHEVLFNKFESLIQETLEQYNVTRTASSDITNVITSAILGAFTFQKFTPGGLGLGFLLAGAIAKKIATAQFFLGETLGGFYYALFPPAPSISLTFGSTLAVLMVMALFSSVSGLISDPFQYGLGLHHRRLLKLIDQLESDFIEKTQSRFRPKDQYIARVLDIFDAIKSHIV